MPLTPYQIVAPLVSFLAVAYAWNLFLRKKKSLLEACFWTLFWGVIAVVAFEPSILHYLSVATGIANQVNAVIFTFLGVLFFMAFYLVMRLEELEQRHVKLMREIALRGMGAGGESEESKESKESKECRK